MDQPEKTTGQKPGFVAFIRRQPIGVIGAALALLGVLIIVLAMTRAINIPFIGLNQGAPGTLTATTHIGRITGIGGKCLDNSGVRKVNDNKIQLYRCNTSDAQRWIVYADGQIKNVNGYCLDVKGAATANSTPVQLYQCNGTAAQKWSVDSKTKHIINPMSGKCLDVKGASTADRTQIQIYKCHSGDAQKWTTPTITNTASSSTSNAITGMGGKCLDNAGNIAKNDNKIQLYRCNGGDGQKWTARAAGDIVNANGFCLDVKSAATTNGTPVQLYTCNNSAAQKWTVNTTNRSIKNPASGKCLDVKNSSAVDGADIQIWDCNGSDAQKWIAAAPAGGGGAPSGNNNSGGGQTGGGSNTGGGQAGNPSNNPMSYIPKQGALLGMFSDPVRGSGIDRLEGQMGRDFDMRMRFTDFNSAGGGILDQASSLADMAKNNKGGDAARIPVLSWQPANWSNGLADNYMGRIGNGEFGDYIAQVARKIRDYKKPVYIRYAHEMNGFWYGWSGCIGRNYKCPASATEDYKRGWRKTIQIFREQGATNVAWIWTPFAINFAQNGHDYKEYYPGDDVVDIVGLDMYVHNPNQTLGDVLGNGGGSVYGDYVNKKPIFIMETMSGPRYNTNPRYQDKSHYFNTLVGVLKGKFPKISGIVLFDENKINMNDGDFSIEKSGNAGADANTLNAFTRMSKDCYYGTEARQKACRGY